MLAHVKSISDLNKLKVRLFVEAVLNEGRLELIDQLVALDYMGRVRCAETVIVGPQGVRQLVSAYRRTAVYWLGMQAVFSVIFSGMVVSDDRKYGPIGVVFASMSWLVAIGVVIILGAVTGVVWRERNVSSRPALKNVRTRRTTPKAVRHLLADHLPPRQEGDAPAAPGGNSRRNSPFADLARDGLTNREIGSWLLVSPRKDRACVPGHEPRYTET